MTLYLMAIISYQYEYLNQETLCGKLFNSVMAITLDQAVYRVFLFKTFMSILFQVLLSDLDEPVNRLLTIGYKIAPVPKSNIYIIIKRKDRLSTGTCCPV